HTGSRSSFAAMCSRSDIELQCQGPGDLGQRLECTLGTVLQAEPWALAIGTDSPDLPRDLLGAAIEALVRHDAVFSPAADGGFVLLGLRRCPPGLLEGLPWSAPETFACTRQRLQDRGLSVRTLRGWNRCRHTGRPATTRLMASNASGRGTTHPRRPGSIA